MNEKSMDEAHKYFKSLTREQLDELVRRGENRLKNYERNTQIMCWVAIVISIASVAFQIAGRFFPHS